MGTNYSFHHSLERIAVLNRPVHTTQCRLLKFTHHSQLFDSLFAESPVVIHGEGLVMTQFQVVTTSARTSYQQPRVNNSVNNRLIIPCKNPAQILKIIFHLFWNLPDRLSTQLCCRVIHSNENQILFIN